MSKSAPCADTPLVLARPGRHGSVVHACNRVARRVGVRMGARVVDMRALCPELSVEEADLEGDRRALARLALWCQRWCPWSAPDGDDGLILDVTGSTHLWGGEPATLAQIETALAGLGLRARLAIAPTQGAAWALARHGAEPRAICTQGEIADWLAPLPVAALRLDAATVLLLHRLGLKTVGALAAIPRSSLARRFARDRKALETPLRRLDQALGRLPEPIVSLAPAKRFRVPLRLAEPVMDPQPYLPGLVEDLCRILAAQARGARRLRLVVFRVDGEVYTVEAATARPTRDATHLLRLFDGCVSTFDPGFGFDALALDAMVVEPLAATQVGLDGKQATDVDLARLIDRLTTRLGAAAVTCPRLEESHVPERAEHWAPALAGGMAASTGVPAVERPLRLLAWPEEVRVLYAVPEGPPIQFVWRRGLHRVTRHAGPERIAPEWWRERGAARLRDYYRIEDSDGRRYWLFREGVAGDGRGGAPRWFMHGLFA
jgi:protein ImuB